jgi:hypothetical protein
MAEEVVTSVGLNLQTYMTGWAPIGLSADGGEIVVTTHTRVLRLKWFDPDCNLNGERDACELADSSLDQNADGVLDACQ